MNRHELLFIGLPLIVMMGWLIINEIKTGLIPDKIVFPAAVYFLTASCIWGSKPWWNYVSGLIALLVIFMLSAILLERITRREMIGGGAIKLMAVVGAALGLHLGIETGILFAVMAIFVLLVSTFFADINSVPSSPLILLSMVLIYIENFIYKFWIPN